MASRDTTETDEIKELFSGFSKLPREERFKRLQAMGVLSNEDMVYLLEGAPVASELAEHFIENAIGYFQMPIGIAANFVIDGRAVVIPMAVEETSIIAAASKTAKWIREHGEIQTEVIGNSIIGQIQVAKVRDFEKLTQYLAREKGALVDLANREVAQGLKARGGGVTDIVLRSVDRGDGSNMAVIHVLVDPVDAMGANIMNQVCEYLKTPIQEATGEVVTMCILSNLVDSKVTKARVVMRNFEPELGARIVEASLFAQRDPYRAATNNKGVLNGIDPILIATGNDWRAVEAGIHAYAAREGRYQSITRWQMSGPDLVGEFIAPVIVGIVGGVTKLHPMAKLSLKILGVKSADELARVCAAVGLVQNLGALRALTTVGIIEGHMKLHIRNLTLGAGATGREVPYVQRRLEEILALTKRITLSQAVEVLRELRGELMKDKVVGEKPQGELSP